MANYEGTGRTNHVLLKDEQAYDDFKACVALLRGSTDETEENGQRLIAAFGHEEDGDFRNSVTATEIVESGYVSRHVGSLLNATLAEHLAAAADPEQVEEDRDADDDCDVLHELYPLLAPGQVLVLKKVGHEKRRYVSGSAEAINSQGQRVSLTLDDIEEMAARAFAQGPAAGPYSRTQQHAYFDYAMWQAEAHAGDTQRGYPGWVGANLEQTRKELDRAEEAFEANGGRGIEAAEEIDELRSRLEVAAE